MAQAAIDALHGKVTLPDCGHALVVRYAGRIPVEFIPITPCDSPCDFELSTDRLIIISFNDGHLHNAYTISSRNLSYKELDIALDESYDMPPEDLSGCAKLVSAFGGKENVDLGGRNDDDDLTRKTIQYLFAGSCGGCLYFVYENENAVLLWNPTTAEFKVIPQSDTCGILHPDMYVVSHCGLGFDPISQDYKFLKDILPFPKWDDEHGFADFFPSIYGLLRILLYNLSTDSWKEIHCNHKMIYHKEHTVFVKGVRYWTGNNDHMSAMIAQSFDFTNETYSYFELPVSKDHHGHFHYPGEYEGSFGVIICPKSGFAKCFEVWSRVKEEWVLKVNLILEDIARPLGFWGKQYLFLEQRSMDNVLVYDMSHSVFKVLYIPNSFEFNMQFLPHIESTVSLSSRNHPKRYNLHVDDTGEEVNLYVGSLNKKATRRSS